MIAKRYNGPCSWERPASDSKKPVLFFCQSNGHVFHTMRTKPCQESAAKLSDLDTAESHGRLDAAIASHTCRDGLPPSPSFKRGEWLNS